MKGRFRGKYFSVVISPLMKINIIEGVNKVHKNLRVEICEFMEL